LKAVSSLRSSGQNQALAMVLSAAVTSLLIAESYARLPLLGVFATVLVILTVSFPPSLKVEAVPGSLRIQTGWLESEELIAQELERVEVFARGGSFQILAIDRHGMEHPIATGLMGKRASDLLAAAIERVVRLEPFLGKRTLAIESKGDAVLEVAVGRWPFRTHLRADTSSLSWTGPLQPSVHLDSDAIAEVGVVQLISVAGASPWHYLEVVTRRGDQRVLALTREAAPLVAFAASARALWRL
jgi:hypothetical protein